MDGTADLRQYYHENGYLLLRRFFDAALIETLKPICSRIFEQWLASHRQAYVNECLINMHSLSDPAYFSGNTAERILFFNTVANGPLVRLCTDLFGDELYFHNTQLFFNPLDPRKAPYWHRDFQYAGIAESEQIALLPQLFNLHARLALIPERGFELIPESHRRWDSAHEHAVRLELDGHNHAEALPGALRLDLEPGDLLIFNAHMLHRGNYALNTARLALDILIGKPHPLMTQWLDAGMLPAREDIARFNFPQWYQNTWSVIENR